MAIKTEPAIIADLGNGLEIWRVHVDQLHEQTKNARSMSPEAFNRLVSTIERGGRLESMPFCATDVQGKLSIISGHHRVRAARTAGVLEVPVLVDVTGLNRSQVVAKQLAHNAIEGTDDKGVLADLFKELATLDDMLESFVDPKQLGIAHQFDIVGLQDIRVAFDVKAVVLAFLPSQLEDFTKACALVPSDAAVVGVVSGEVFDRFVATARELGKQWDILSVGALVSKMCDVVLDSIAHEKALDMSKNGLERGRGKGLAADKGTRKPDIT